MRRIQHSPEWRITGEPYIEDNYTDFGYEQMINAMRINIQHWIRYPLFSGVKRGRSIPYLPISVRQLITAMLYPIILVYGL